ncbi:hypothetical protein Salat_0215900 [Sesamum alatum]|uniref:Uncharacterized protein n=1 Tax=Sesamum alatum TaxID=300844 RepID=A0AAE2CY58_9LAMI|nr:hypothetical protein Salat_0215900 [Sesamum alatum]
MDNGHYGSGSDSGTNRSGRPNSRHTGSSSADDVMRICSCGREIVLRTSWTTANPGATLPCMSGKSDPPMCRRSKEVIPGLLNRLKQYDVAIRRAKERLDNANMRRRNCHCLLFFVVFYWACSVLLTIRKCGQN